MRPSELAPEAVDCHVHAGLERAQSLEAVLRYCRDDGREVLGLVDHAELFMKTPPDWAVVALEHARRRAGSPDGPRDVAGVLDARLDGPEVFYRHAREGVHLHGEGMRVAVGLEINGDSLKARLVPAGWLDGADFLGICTTQPPAEGLTKRPWGEHLAELVSLADELRGGRKMGLVLHHPFRWRLYEMAREMAWEMAQDAGVSLREAAGFTEEDARVTAKALCDAGALAEVNFASYYSGYIRQQVGADRTEDVLAAARGALARLKDAGVKFSLGSDMHALPRGTGVYRPSGLLETLGIGMDDVELPFPLAGDSQERWP